MTTPYTFLKCSALRVAHHFTRTTIVGILLLSAMETFGQTEQGRALFGGSSSLGFNSSGVKHKSDNHSEDGRKTTTLSFSPQVGFFLADGFALGLELPLSFSSANDPNDDSYKSTDFALIAAPFARYFFGNGNVKPYLQGQVGLGTLKSKVEFGNSSMEDKLSLFQFGFKGGAAFFFSDNVAVDIGLGYSSTSYKTTEDNPNNNRAVINNIGLNVGFIITI